MKSNFPKWLAGLLLLMALLIVLFKASRSSDSPESKPAASEPGVGADQGRHEPIQISPRHFKTQPVNPPQNRESASDRTFAETKSPAEERSTVADQTRVTSGQTTSRDSKAQQASSPRTQATGAQAVESQPVALPADVRAAKEKAQQLAAAAAQGDLTAVKALQELNAALRQTVYSDPRSTKQPGETDSRERDAFITDSFKPIHDAIDSLSEEAAKGNQNALDALAHAAQERGLQSFAMDAIGKLAADGNKSALDALIHPEQFGLLPSSTVGALKSVADTGNQQAIDALVAVTTNPKMQALWFMAANGLEKAAALGNDAAIDALIPLAGSTDQNLRNVGLAGLQRAAKNQNQKARTALRTLDPQGSW